jgi:hypothetical protein
MWMGLKVPAKETNGMLMRPLPSFTQDFAKGETIALMSHASPSKAIRYSTVQVSEHDHIELNSE